MHGGFNRAQIVFDWGVMDFHRRLHCTHLRRPSRGPHPDSFLCSFKKLLMRVVTVGTGTDGYYDTLVESCSRLGLELTNLGTGQKWEGLITKVRLFKDYLRTVPDDEVIMFVDAYDVVIIEEEAAILRKFRSFQKPIVFSVQKGLFARTFIGDSGQDGSLCTGTYMGYARAIRELLDLAYTEQALAEGLSDQFILNEAGAANPFFKEKVACDSDQEIFFVTDFDDFFAPAYWLSGDINGLTPGPNRALSASKGQPSVVHFAAALDGNKYIRHLGYDPSRVKPIAHSFKLRQVGNYFLLWLAGIGKYIVLALLLAAFIIYRSFSLPSSTKGRVKPRPRPPPLRRSPRR